MRFFTRNDLLHAAGAMLSNVGLRDTSLMGTMSGIKRRARARAIAAFGKQLDPAPPDSSITTIRTILGELFGRSISNNDLHRHFATPGRKANDRVDMIRLNTWLQEHRPRFQIEADKLIDDLNEEWKELTRAAAREAGNLRRDESISDQ